MRPTRRNLLLSTTAAAMLLANGASAQQTELTYAGWLNLYGAYVDTVTFMEKDFQEKNPDIKFIRNDVPFDQALQQATVSILAGNPADVLHLNAGWIATLTDIEGLEPLNDLFTEEEWAQIPDALVESVTYDGNIMSMPWVPAPIIMFYNRNLMEEAGLDPENPPQTWEELAEQARAICALPDRDGAPVYGVALRTQRNPNSAQWTIPIVYGHGGDLVDEAGEVTINTPEMQAAWTWVADLIQEDCAPAGFSIDETRNTMAAGRAGFIFEGPWGRGLFSNLSGGTMTTAPDGDIWVAPMPAGPDGERRTIGNPHQIGIAKASPNKEAAAEFIRYVIFDPDFTEAYFQASQQLSTSSTELLSTGSMGADAYTQIFVDALAHTTDVPIKTAKFTAIMDELAPALQAVIQGADVDAELAQAERRVARVLSR